MLQVLFESQLTIDTLCFWRRFRKEEEEVEEALELDEFEYKGVTYYRDSENQVYQVDVDGDLDDTPIGVWSVEKGKILKYAK